MLGGCVIGVGLMGSHHARILHELESERKIKFLGVADLKRENGERAADIYNVKCFVDYNDLLAMNPDFAVVAVPTISHEKVSVDVMKAGCHALVEKPIAPTVEQAERIISASKKLAVNLMVGHIERFNPAVVEMGRMTAGKAIKLIGAVRAGPMPPPHRVEGVVIDLAIHDIDLIRHLSGSEIKSFNSFLSEIENNMERSAVLSFEMESGALAFAVSNIITPLKIRVLEVTADDLFIRADLISQKVTSYSGGELISHARRSSFVTEIDVPYLEPLKSELEAFIGSIENSSVPPVSGEDALKTLKVAIKCVERSES